MKRFALLLIAGLLLPAASHAIDHGFDPNSPVTQWFETKMMPPGYGVSCCGKGDAYLADKYWKNPDGSYEAVVDDGSSIAYPDGSYRRAIPDGTQVHIPAEAVNREEDDLDNPIDHSVLWLLVGNEGEVKRVWCFIRHPKGM